MYRAKGPHYCYERGAKKVFSITASKKNIINNNNLKIKLIDKKKESGDTLWLKFNDYEFPMIVEEIINQRSGHKEIHFSLLDSSTGRSIACLSASIDTLEKNGHVSGLNTYKLSCEMPLELPKKGKVLLDLFSEIVKAYGFHKIYLEDLADFSCISGNKIYTIYHKIFGLIKHGQTIYERYGFKNRLVKLIDLERWLFAPLNLREVLTREDIRFIQKTKAKPLITELLAKSNNRYNDDLDRIKNYLVDDQTVQELLVSLIDNPDDEYGGNNCGDYELILAYLRELSENIPQGLAPDANNFLQAWLRLISYPVFMEKDV